MKLNKTSWYGALYSKTYTTELPNNLCSFFWKMVLSIIFFIPFFLWFLLYELAQLCDNNFKYDAEDIIYTKGESFGSATLANIAIPGILFCIYSIIQCFFHPLQLIHLRRMTIADALGLSFIFLFFVLIVVVGLKWLISKIKSQKTVKEPKQNILIEFIKAKKNKYCTKIEWE